MTRGLRWLVAITLALALACGGDPELDAYEAMQTPMRPLTPMQPAPMPRAQQGSPSAYPVAYSAPASPGTGVYVNGQELTLAEVQQIGGAYPGRYWLDAQGNFGAEGGPALGNVYTGDNAGNGGGGGNEGPWTSPGGGIGNEQGGAGYVCVDGNCSTYGM